MVRASVGLLGANAVVGGLGATPVCVFGVEKPVYPYRKIAVGGASVEQLACRPFINVITSKPPMKQVIYLP